MKAIKKSMILLAALFLSLSGCNPKSSGGSGTSHLSLIPGDAIFVVGVEFKKIVDKGGLNKPDDFKFFSLFRSEFNEKQQKAFDEFVKDPKSAGLDLDVFYVYARKTELESDVNVTCVIKLHDESKFVATIKDLGAPEPEDKGEYKLILDNGTFAWNKDYLILVAGDGVETLDFASLLTANQETSISANEGFKAFQSNTYDLGIWADYGVLIDLYSTMMGLDKMDVFELAKGTYVYGYLNFENGEINGKGTMGPKEKVDEVLAKYPIIKKDFDETLYQGFPEQSFLAMKMSLNVKEYLNFIKTALSECNADDSYNPYSELFSAFEDPSVQKIVNALGGDILFSLYGFVEGMFPIPTTSIAFTVNGEQGFQDLLASLPANMWSKTGEHYTLVMGGGVPMSVLFAYKDSKVYVSDDIEGIKKFLDKGFDKNIASGSLGAQLKKDLMLFYLNLDLDSYPDHIKLLLQNTIGGRAYKQFTSYMNIYKELSYGVTNNYEAECSLKLKNTTVNALKQILKNIDENTSSLY
ncbi:MAG: DUF4836 family protein [Prevotellaceae bacterium]|jgi:hypothetical protein|nr:DUF4836 family protein [Prevotellaceae bacterium]